MKTHSLIARLRHCIRPLHCAAALGALMVSAAYGQTSMPPMQGMDHGNMDHGSMHGKGDSQKKAQPAPTKPTAKPASPNITTPGKPQPASESAPDHAGHQMAPSQPPSPPTSPPRKYESPDLRASKEYRRNPDGSIPIPGETMAMADNDIFNMVLFDQLEYVDTHDGRGVAWDAQGWVGRDYNRLWIKAEGERLGGESNSRLEGLWSHAFAAFWDWQLGMRHDSGNGPSRQWLAFGVQGIAPYWFDIEATGYVGPSGRTAALFKANYTVRLSQVTFLTPELEANAYGKSDPARGIGSGLSDVSLGLRLRYEIRREFAPYIGIAWTRKLGNTADLARQAGESVSDRQIVAGVRVWF